MDMADTVIALGPGFEAGKDVHYVVETKRGHNLGRIYTSGSAAPNTGIPGIIGGYGKERVMHTPVSGIWHPQKQIGDIVEKDDTIGIVQTENGESIPVKTSIPGLVRGVLPDNYPVPAGFKAADVDPRIEQQANCTTISDKARCIAGGVLEACLRNK
jgi:xanthine dehydrogenase accessory factor